MCSVRGEMNGNPGDTQQSTCSAVVNLAEGNKLMLLHMQRITIQNMMVFRQIIVSSFSQYHSVRCICLVLGIPNMWL